MPQPLFALSAEVADALAAGRPVVALESTIVTHGLPGWEREAPPDSPSIDHGSDD